MLVAPGAPLPGNPGIYRRPERDATIIEVGDTLAVGAGQMIPVDGVITVGYQMAIVSKAMQVANASVGPTLLHTVDTVIFDKTGTLTLDQPQVAHIYLFNGASEPTLLAYAAVVEDRQSHPIARAIVAAAQARALTLPPINDAAYEVGYGIKAWIDGRLIRIGSDRFMALATITLPPAVGALQAEAHAHGHSLVMVALDDELAGIIELAPTSGTVDLLHSIGLASIPTGSRRYRQRPTHWPWHPLLGRCAAAGL